MKILLTILIASCLASPLLAKGLTFGDYKILNTKETRLIDYKDSDEMLAMKFDQLQIINKSRKKHKVQLVELDIFASRLANKIATEAARNNYMGHFNLKGEKPYQQYALAGGTDHIMENAASLSEFSPQLVSNEFISKSIVKLHAAFMSEKAPNDGHKKNCIDPNHNFVGIGVAIDKQELRYYEEYIDRYLEVGTFSKTVKPNQSLTIPVKLIDASQTVYVVMMYRENSPKPMTARKISSINSYNDYGDETIITIPPWEIPKPQNNGTHLIPLTVKGKGWYYVQVFVSKTAYTGGKASTKNKIPATSIVIMVD